VLAVSETSVNFYQTTWRNIPEDKSSSPQTDSTVNHYTDVVCDGVSVDEGLCCIFGLIHQEGN
jgi:hypothetical protein